MESLADIFMGAVQYNEEGVLMSINELCGIMTNSSQEYQDEMEAYNRLVKLSQVWRTERAPSPPLHVDMWPPDVTAEPFSCMSAVRLRAKNKQCKHLWFLYAFTFMQLPQHLSTSFVSFLFLSLCMCFCTWQIYRFTSKEPCLDISYEKSMKDLMDTSVHAGRRGERQWTYQTCTEFGFCTTQTHTDTCFHILARTSN